MSVSSDVWQIAKSPSESVPSKYKRWTPLRDQILVDLLSDVVHSYFPQQTPALDRYAWRYVCSRLRREDPASVYSTYTKYSCQQHLLNVINHRYRIWHQLIEFSTRDSGQRYSYRWNVNSGRFEMFRPSSTLPVDDQNEIKLALGDSRKICLPALGNVHRGTMVVTELFLTSNMKYMPLYHSEVLPLLTRTDKRYNVGDNIPQLHQSDKAYGIPLKIAPTIKYDKGDEMKIQEEPNSEGSKKSKPLYGSESFSRRSYIKDGIWVRRLIMLERISLLSNAEVLKICEGVRDGRIPSFMLNILDPAYTGEKKPVLDDEETAKEVRDFMLPFTETDS